MIFDGYIKIRESLYTWVIFWINIILEHVETRVIIPRFEDSCMVYRPKWCQKKKKKKPFKYSYPIGIKKKITQMIWKNTIPYQHWYKLGELRYETCSIPHKLD